MSEANRSRDPHSGPDRLARRRLAASLLDAVRFETLSARQALNRWPVRGDEPEGWDSSLDVACQALMYFEADEDRHRQELFYLDTQLELLRQMAWHLAQGQDLPPHLCSQYTEKAPREHTVRFYDEKRLLNDSLTGWRRDVIRTLDTVGTWFRQALHAAGVPRL